MLTSAAPIAPMTAAALPPLGVGFRTRQIVQEDFNAIVFDHCCSSRHGFSQGVNLFGVQHLI